MSSPGFIGFATGLRYLKEHQDHDLSPELHYVRYLGEVPVGALAVHEDDEPKKMDESLRIVICMTKESSRRLLRAQYLQSDIAFKRIAGFLEFEIGGWNENAKICLYYSHLSVFPTTDLIPSADILPRIRQLPVSSCTSPDISKN